MKNKIWGKVLFILMFIYSIITPVCAENNLVSDYGVASSNASVSSIEMFLFIVLLISFFGIVGYIIYMSITKNNYRRNYEVDNEDVQNILPEYTLDSLKKELYDEYITILQAYSNYQYDQIDKYCYFDLAHEYKTELGYLHDKHATNIMNDFEFIDMKIQDVRKEGDNVVVKVYLKSRYIDYTVDDKNVLLRGDYKNKITSEEYMVFYRRRYNGRIIKFCPKCGGKVINRNCGDCGIEVMPKNNFQLRRKGAFL